MASTMSSSRIWGRRSQWGSSALFALIKHSTRHKVLPEIEVKPTTGQQIAGKEIDNDGLQKDGSSAASKPAECKKYFPSVGGMVSVPCEG
jgi:hypothetical protein